MALQEGIRAMSDKQAKQAKGARLTIAQALRKRGWAYDTGANSLRRRIYCLFMESHPWWDWGHRLMILVGQDFGGNWSEPQHPTWWYKRVHGKPMWRTGYPRSDFQIVTSYSEFRSLTEGLNEDGMYEWKAISTSQAGELHLGHQYWGGNFYGLPRDEWALVGRWLRVARRNDWWGLRSWLYSQALHAAVYRRKPFACNASPPKGQGGYSHWLCHLKRRHDGMHRFNNYVWGDIDGEPIGAHHIPLPRDV